MHFFTSIFLSTDSLVLCLFSRQLFRLVVEVEPFDSTVHRQTWMGRDARQVCGTSAVVTFDQAAVAYAEDGGEARFPVKISEKLAGEALHSITPQIVRNAAKKAYPKPHSRNS